VKISTLLEGIDETSFSLEVYPPKIMPINTSPSIQNQISSIFETIEQLISYKPLFVSVTYNPIGKTKLTSIPIAAIIKQRFNVEVVAHLTGISTPKEEIHRILDLIDYFDINNVLALRGDLPKDIKSNNNSFFEMQYASELVEEIKQHKYLDMGIGVACYPEGHLECKNEYGKRDFNKDLYHLKMKVEKGVDFAITQLFYDNKYFYSFIENASKIGVTIPIIPGIMPILNYKNLQMMTQLSGAKIPNFLKQKLENNKDDPEEIKAIGIEHAINQCKGLIGKVPCIHFYTMDKWESIQYILEELSEINKPLLSL